jgi:type I restriction enzyme R subunit
LETLPEATQFAFHKHFNRQVQACLDRGLGECWLRKQACIDIVRRKLLEDDGGGWHTGDFVIMPNHAHVLITPAIGFELEAVLKQIKGASAVECNRAIKRSGTFWQAESYDHIVRSLEQLYKYREYIAHNSEEA